MVAIASSMLAEDASVTGAAFSHVAWAAGRMPLVFDLPFVRVAGTGGRFVLNDARRPGARIGALAAGRRSAVRRADEMTRTPRRINKPAPRVAGPDDINW